MLKKLVDHAVRDLFLRLKIVLETLFIRVYAKKHLRFQFALSNLRFQNYKKRVCEAFAVSFMLFHLNFQLLLTSIMVNFKKPARKLSLRKRFLALSSNEAVYVRSLDKRLLKLMTGLKQLRLSKQCKSEGISLAKAIAEEIINVMIEPTVQLSSLASLHTTIDSLSDSECWNFFETRKEDMHRLKVNLKFEDKCILENGSVLSGEEVLLRGLYELVSGADQHEIIDGIL